MAEPITVAAPGPVDLADDVDVDGDLLGDLDDLDEAPPVIDVDQVRRFLAGIGSTLQFTVGNPAVPDHWRFADDELDILAPALAGIANRRPAVARAIERSDHVVVAAALARYVGRNVQAGRRARPDEGEPDGVEPQARPVGGFGLAARHGNGAP